MRISASTIFKIDKHNRHEVVVQVQSRCNYRVTVDWTEEFVQIEAPGLDKTIDFDDEKFKWCLPDDEEALAIALVAMMEGGVEL